MALLISLTDLGMVILVNSCTFGKTVSSKFVFQPGIRVCYTVEKFGECVSGAGMFLAKNSG